jgi:hypothetical protein
MNSCDFNISFHYGKCEKESTILEPEIFHSVKVSDVEETEDELICTLEFETEEDLKRFVKAMGGISE